MKTEALDKCLELLSHERRNDPGKMAILADLGAEFTESYIEPFRRELGLNILSKTTIEEKKDLIGFYFDELNHSFIAVRLYEEIEPLNPGVEDFTYPIWYKDEYETDDSGIAEVRGHILFSMLFEVIQDYCNVYRIPFLELCKDRLFVPEMINIQPTRDFEELNECQQAVEQLNTNAKKNSDSVQVHNPVFTHEYLLEIYSILRDFFSKDEQDTLIYLLETGAELDKPLVFLDTGNRLADAFKQLYESNIIVDCQKKELESWICRNFVFVHRQKIKRFIPKYLNEIISTTKDKCQRPILNVKFDKVDNRPVIIKL
jgi:hypothetical protein